MKKQKYSSLGSLLSAIILFIFGTVLFKDPGDTMVFITRVVGAIICLVGIFLIVIFTRKKKKNIETTNIDLISGVFFLVFGIITIVIAGALETALRYILGTWMLYSGIMKLIAALTIGPTGKSYTSMLFLSLAFIVLGVYSILISNIGLSLIGILLMIYSALEIVGYILYIIGGHEEEPKKKEKLLFKKDGNIKDAKEIEYKEKR